MGIRHPSEYPWKAGQLSGVPFVHTPEQMCIRDSLGADGAMVTGQQTIDGKWYIMDTEGRMITEPVTLTPDQDGALQWPGLVQ